MEQKVELSVFIKTVILTLHGLISLALVWAGINSEVFFILTVLLVTDFITGVWKAHSLGENVNSNRMKYGIVSKLSLLIIPIIFGLGVRALGQNGEQILFVAMNMLILSEIYSIIGNIYATRTGVELPEYDVLREIAKKIRNRLEGSGSGSGESSND